MPSGWDVYYVVFLSALLALSLPFGLMFVSKMMRRPSKKPIASMPSTSTLREDLLFEKTGLLRVLREQKSTELGQRVNTRFFMSANAALALIAFGLILIPCAGMLQPDLGKGTVLRGLIVFLSLTGCSFLGLLYSARKGDLNWLTSYNKMSQETTPGLSTANKQSSDSSAPDSFKNQFNDQEPPSVRV